MLAWTGMTRFFIWVLRLVQKDQFGILCHCVYTEQGRDLQKRVWYRRMACWHAPICIYMYSVLSSANAEWKTFMLVILESCNYRLLSFIFSPILFFLISLV